MGGAAGGNNVGVGRRAQEYNYVTLCEHGGSKVQRTIFVGFDFEVINFIIKFPVIILLRDDL